MIYVQPQISCTLPLKLFVRSKHLIDSDIIEKKDRRTISRPCKHKIKHYAEYTHIYTYKHKHTHTQTQTYMYTHNTQTHVTAVFKNMSNSAVQMYSNNGHVQR